MTLTRRSVLRSGALAALAGSAGCVTRLTDTASASAGTGLAPGSLSFRDGFGGEAAAIRERYGDAGVWGTAAGPSLGPRVEYVGAWRGSLTVPERPDGRPFARADAAALVYQLSGDEGSGTAERHRVWFWTGVRPVQREGRLGRSNATRLAVEVAPGEGWSLAAVAPRAPRRDGPVRVSLDERGPSGRTPLPGGGIAADELRTGPGGRAVVAWQGVAGTVRSVNAVAGFAPDDTGASGEDIPPFEAVVDVSVSAARGVL